MYLYWRIQQDLSSLGEFIQFHDPALRNAMQKWVRKNYSRMVTAESLHYRCMSSDQDPSVFISHKIE